MCSVDGEAIKDAATVCQANPTEKLLCSGMVQPVWQDMGLCFPNLDRNGDESAKNMQKTFLA